MVADMTALRIAPDAATANGLIRAAAGRSDLGRAREVYQNMMERGPAPNAYTYSILFRALQSADNAVDQQWLFEVLLTDLSAHRWL